MTPGWAPVFYGVLIKEEIKNFKICQNQLQKEHDGLIIPSHFHYQY